MNADENDDLNMIDVPTPEAPQAMSSEEKELWQLKKKGDAGARNELVEKYYWIVAANSKNVIDTIVAATEEGDFDQAGMIGYLEAIKDYDIDEDIRFEDFASMKIREAIIEELNNFIRE